ncbi:valine--tRNA ligase [Spiroplasma chrysopicola]|uniref:Valine--tRNA ligase n=1 Tax=Spiroplasma chrysopicola DF-1 TaxID=1276227 RepID=R4UAK0_9MOLU|nr:valine--tRNA ligase [Spiroplasma chrysopicola]AGM24939.1 valyl-tRNA synthetase [Spiroplasma chrysopicola DF-1]
MKKELAKKYDPQNVEQDKYQTWVDKGYFTAKITKDNPAFSIVIPPPNVTGKLHLGHAWDTSLQDLIIRYKKLNGYDTLYLPGMDHAGIATQAKVEERLRTTKNQLRHDLGREKFIDQVWEWKEEYAQIIRDQWAKLGLALDYSKEQFTLNDNLSGAVQKVFIDLYEKGLIYQGKKIISWDPKQKTALSNIEVIYQEQVGKMYYFKYFLANSTNEFLSIATTRPETMFADQCVVVNSTDERYQQYWNQQVINPANGELIPVICDDYVEKDFGTGAMKCTPAHDANDFEIGKRHNLAMPICMNLDGTLNEMAGKYEGQDRFTARTNLVNDLTAQDLVVKIENHVHQVGFSERSGVVVEPYLSKQWFVKMDYFADKILKFQSSKDKINFFPPRFDKTLQTWMENIQDWCISRQLWWGHQIPAWYHRDDESKVFVGTEPPNETDWYQDEDVLDTWFSSALWPFTTLGWNWNEELFNHYFPTNVLVTGYDIIFFWVSRMMFQSLEFTNNKPFNDVLIHGLIRDEKGQKMSKSLGNGIDPMDVISEYGADTLRYFLVTNSAPGQDLRYSEEKIKAAWNFLNKLWNAARFVEMNRPADFKLFPDYQKEIKPIIEHHQESIIDCWILSELTLTVKAVKANMEKYEFVLVAKDLYDFIWNKFCSWYIELAKVNLGSDNQEVMIGTQQTLFFVLKQIIIMLHPFVPFITEEIYQTLNLKPSIMLEEYPTFAFTYQTNFLNEVVKITGLIRELRTQYQIPKTQALSLIIKTTLEQEQELSTALDSINKFIIRLVNSEITSVVTSFGESKEYIAVPLEHYTLYLKAEGVINNELETTKRTAELARLEKEIARSKNILENANFLAKASPEKIKIEQDKYNDYLKQYANLTAEQE